MDKKEKKAFFSSGSQVHNDVTKFQTPHRTIKNRISDLGTVRGVLIIIVLVLLIASIFRLLVNGSSVPRLENLLQLITNLPSVSFSTDLLGQISGSWVIDTGLFSLDFNWLKEFCNIVLSCLSVLYWLGSNVFYIFRFFFRVVQWLFVG